MVMGDGPERRLALRLALEPLGERVLEAGSEAEALRLLLHEDCAVVLMDVVMPGMSGTEMAAMIRADPRSRHVPIIFLTDGSSSDESVFRGYAGAVELSHQAV